VRYLIRHETRRTFPAPVREHHCELRLAPIEDAQQRVHALRIGVEPAARLATYADAFGNRVHYFDVLAQHAELVTRLEVDVETALVDPFDFRLVPSARQREWIAEALHAHPPLWDFVLHRSPCTPALVELAIALPPPGWDDPTPLLNAVQMGMVWVERVLDHVEGASPVETPLATVVERGTGASQDFAHLLVTLVRSWGVPARYVTGYLDPGYAPGGAAGTQATHGWAEVLVPGAGWRGFDAVHGLVANDTYVRVAVGRDGRDAAPERCVFHGQAGTEPTDVRLAVVRQQQQQQQ
jgi:transglutaminase-like putative cysteine protease